MSKVIGSPFFYVGVPVSVLLLPYVATAAGFGGLMYGESGVIERLTVLFLVVAIAVLIIGLRDARRLGGLLFPYWLVLLCGAVYFCGEEVSWGQWVFYWGTPENWKMLNDQQETNLHNLHGVGFLLDQLPRLLLSVAAFFGGICVPLYCLMRPGASLAHAAVTDWQGWLPTVVCLPAATAALLVRPVETLAEGLRAPEWAQAGSGELKECLLALFILTYVAVLRQRMRESNR